MTILAEISAYDPPVLITAILGSIMFLAVLWNQISEAVARSRGKSPEPPNEVLGARHSEIFRRVDHLEFENSKVWAKMESDKDKWQEALRVLTAEIAALKTSADNLSTQCALLAHNFNQAKK